MITSLSGVIMFVRVFVDGISTAKTTKSALMWLVVVTVLFCASGDAVARQSVTKGFNRLWQLFTRPWQPPSPHPVLVLRSPGDKGPNFQDQQGNTALHRAAQSGDLAAMENLFTELDLDLEIENNAGLSAYRVAVASSQAQAASLLLQEMTGINGHDQETRTPLYWAVSSGDRELVRALLHAGAHISAGRQNALEIAELRQDAEMLQILLQESDAISQQKALRWAMIKERTDIVEEILSYGVNYHHNVLDYQQRAALHIAVIHAETAVATLLAQGADPKLAEGITRYTPLHVAAQSGRLDAARLLVDAGAYLDAPDMDGSTPLILAASNGDTEMVAYLLDKGANPLLANYDGKEAASGAAFNNHVETRDLIDAHIAARQR